MRHERAKAECDQARSLFQALFQEWRALAEPFLEATPPFPKDQVLAIEAEDARLKAAERRLHTAIMAFINAADEEGLDVTTLL